MAISNIIATIDRELAVLRQARELLSEGVEPVRHSAGAHAEHAAKPAHRARGRKRRLSPEGRRRIAEAVKRRWELQRKATAASKKEVASK